MCWTLLFSKISPLVIISDCYGYGALHIPAQTFTWYRSWTVWVLVLQKSLLHFLLGLWQKVKDKTTAWVELSYLWREGSAQHPLCPVFAVRKYKDTTPGASVNSLLVWHNSPSSCSRVHITLTLVTNQRARHRKFPCVHDIRRYTKSLVVMRTRSLQRVQ